MGGRPLAALATACFPPNSSQDHAQRLADSLHRAGERFACPVVGGDVATFPAAHSGPLVITITLLGAAHHAGPILRSTARTGDAVYVTGTIGGAVTSGRHMTFQPRLAEARELSEALWGWRPTAMIDISDGLGMDAARVGRASNVKIVLDATRIPLSAGVTDWRQAVAEGEDYELLFTAAPDARIADRLGQTPVMRIGRVEPPGDAPGCIIKDADGREYNAAKAGFVHGK